VTNNQALAVIIASAVALTGPAALQVLFLIVLLTAAGFSYMNHQVTSGQ
jgi:hypothetical protein